MTRTVRAHTRRTDDGFMSVMIDAGLIVNDLTSAAVRGAVPEQTPAEVSPYL